MLKKSHGVAGACSLVLAVVAAAGAAGAPLPVVPAAEVDNASILKGPERSLRAAIRAERARQRQERRRDARRKRQQRFAKLPGGVSRSTLEAIAACESHGDPKAIGGGGAYRGKYQFAYGTWASVGGQGDPAAAPEAEQDHRAALLYARSGPGQWPVCGA